MHLNKHNSKCTTGRFSGQETVRSNNILLESRLHDQISTMTSETAIDRNVDLPIPYNEGKAEQFTGTHNPTLFWESSSVLCLSLFPGLIRTRIHLSLLVSTHYTDIGSVCVRTHIYSMLVYVCLHVLERMHVYVLYCFIASIKL